MEFLTSDAPGKWRQEPVSRCRVLTALTWGELTPFVLRSGSQFRIPPPPALNSPAYAAAFNEVWQLGGDGLGSASTRTADQTFLAVYWACDGTLSLCAPPRLYNEIAAQIAEERGSNAVDTARLLAIANVAMADAART